MSGVRRYTVAAPSTPARVSVPISAAKQQLAVAHATLEGIFDSLHLVRLEARQHKSARGQLAEGERDLLRSALVLAGSGMEAVVKRLVTDALPVMLAEPSRHKGPLAKYKDHVRLQLENQRTPPSWLQAIIADEPRPEMTNLYVQHLIGGSIQSEADLKVLRDALGLPKASVSDASITGLRGFLVARNQVAHDLDLKMPGDAGSRTRHRRTISTVVKQCDQVLGLTRDFVCATAGQLPVRRGAA